MKLIIDIPEEVSVAISRMGLLRIPDEMQKKVDKAIQHGTPIKQEPKTGHWIDIMVGDVQAQACDQCKTFYPLAYTGGGHKYCPNCGAKMESEEI